jgi:hypothetical protein
MPAMASAIAPVTRVRAATYFSVIVNDPCPMIRRSAADAFVLRPISTLISARQVLTWQ